MSHEKIVGTLRVMNSRTRTKIQNSAFSGGTSGALGSGDRGAFQNVPFTTGNPYESNDYVYRWRQYTHLYEIAWEARKIIRIPAEDALRKKWVLEGIGEEFIKYFETEFIRLDFHQILKRSLMLERLLGGCITFFGLGGEQKEETKDPFNPKKGSKIYYANAIPVSRISRVTWDNNPLSEYYMRPSMYAVNGQEVHISRCLIWDGEPLFDPYDFALTNFRSNLAGFGPSKLAPIWDDIIKAVGTRQAAYQMIQTNNAIIASVNDLQDLMGTVPGKKNVVKIKEMVNQLSLYRAALIDGDNMKIDTVSAKFGSVPELLMTFIQILSAASDIPATRFIGEAPGGLNSTGKSDLENYYNTIDSMQVQRLVPAIRRTCDILGYSKFGDLWTIEREKLDVVFPPLWNLSELEEAERAQLRLANVMTALENNMISDEKAIEEMNLKKIFSVELDDIDIQIQDDLGMKGGLPGEPGTSQEDPRQKLQQLKGNIDQKVQQIKNRIYIRNADKEGLLIKQAGGDPDKVDREQFKKGMKVELEHNDITNGDLVKIAKIVLAHLEEKENYYTLLQKVENDSGNFKEEEYPRDKGKFAKKEGSGSSEKDQDKKELVQQDDKKDKESQGAVKRKRSAPIPPDDKKAHLDKKFAEAQAKRTLADQAAFQKAREKGIAVPPAWTEVTVYDEMQSNGWLATGKDEAGQWQHTIPKDYYHQTVVNKMNRISSYLKDSKQVQKYVNELKKQIDKSEEAKVLYLVSQTAFRVGGESIRETKVKAYGASTLLGTHVRVEGNSVYFQFPGKKGVQQDHVINDKLIADMLRDKAGKEEPLFNTDDTKVLKSWRKLTGKNDAKTHDWRSYWATNIAQQELSKFQKPQDEVELKKIIKAASVAAAKKLGNNPAQCLESYINPDIFKEWRN